MVGKVIQASYCSLDATTMFLSISHISVSMPIVYAKSSIACTLHTIGHLSDNREETRTSFSIVEVVAIFTRVRMGNLCSHP